ncbi:AP-5 complex subunit zeta-1-like isoform X2 [Actinia tenebrosa]|nr:AP-5 complex subunit zeta-1-like isoform X2 [Actinia tenebrosa]
MAHWLRHASTVSAPNPYQRQLFGGSKNRGYQAVSEIDGTASRFFYTILSIAHYSFPDQFLNIYTFSMLRSWLLNTGAVQAELDQGPVYTPQEGTPPLSFTIGSSSRSPSENISQSPSRESLSFQDGILKRSQDNLDNISINSQSSIGMFIPPISQSPVSQMTSSPTESLGSRSQTPLNFPLTAEDPEERPQSQVSSSKGQRKLSRNISFAKLFTQQGPKTGQQELRENACEYCLRVLEQSERRPTKLQDSQIVEAGLLEAILTLDRLCTYEKSLIPKLIEIVRRIYSRVTADMNRWNRVVLAVVQFLLNHGESVVFDPEPACKAVFRTMINAFYFRPSFAFEVVMFCLDNVEKLCSSTSVFTKYFPNLFKILAWSPRTFLREFMQLLPVMMSEDTVVEVFHSILDLPCLSASVCASWAARGRISNNSDSQASIPASVTAFLDPKHRPLFSFILRPEAGHGDTISRLKALHILLEDMADHPRVVVSSQVAPPLLNLYFSTLLNEAEMDTVSKLIPVILERSVLLYDSQTFQPDIRRILAEKLVLIFQRYPCLVATHKQDLVDFITGFKNLGPEKEEFFINLVWSIGEFASTAYEGGCTVQMIVQYFETLEALTYEVAMQTAPGKVVFSGKLVSVFMSALAKLASRCQDLTQRAILCCSKVVRQKPELLSDPECYDDLVTRAQELIQLLKLPNVAPVILNPDAEWITGRWHRDKNTSLPLLLQTTKLVLS